MSYKILVIDDDPSIVNLLREDLEAEGYEIVEGYDGQTAVDLARSEQPDLIIMDVNLPSLSGPQALSSLRETPETKQIPVIFLTGDSSSERQSTEITETLVTHLKKPFDLDNLNVTVRRLLPPAA